MNAEKYIKRSKKTKQKTVNKLLDNVFVAVVKRSTWGSHNTPSVHINALRPVVEGDIFQGHLFTSGAFKDIRTNIKQEKIDASPSAKIGTLPSSSKKRKTKQTATSRASKDTEDDDTDAKSIISIGDSDYAPSDNADAAGSSSGKDDAGASSSSADNNDETPDDSSDSTTDSSDDCSSDDSDDDSDE